MNDQKGTHDPRGSRASGTALCDVSGHIDVLGYVQEVRERGEGLSVQVQQTVTASGLLLKALGELMAGVEALAMAEKVLRAQNAALAAFALDLTNARGHYHDLFASAPCAYLVTDTHGLIQEANPAAGQLLGEAPRYMVGKSFLRYVPDELRRASGEDFQREFRERTLQWECGSWLQPRRAAPFEAVIAITPLSDHSGVTTALRWLIHPADKPEAQATEGAGGLVSN